MKNRQQKKIAPDKELGALAMEFRGTRDEKQRKLIAEKYARVLNELISTKKRVAILPLEDQLPDEWMPATFFEWLHNT